MFVCDDCLSRYYTNPERSFKSCGCCEVCGKTRDCNDIKSNELVSNEADEDDYNDRFPLDHDSDFIDYDDGN